MLNLNKLFLVLIIMLTSLLSHSETLHRRQFLSEQFSQKDHFVKVAFFDADSTLRVALSGGVSAKSPTDVMILPFVAKRISELNQAGYLVMIVSNQGGVGKGVLPIETADAALMYTIDLIKKENPQALIHYYDFAENSDQMRKPGIGMAQNLEAVLKAKGLQIDWARSFMVGDSAYEKTDIKPDGSQGVHFSNSDRLFAVNLHIQFAEPTDFFGWRCHGIDVFEKPEQVRSYQKEHTRRCSVVKIY